MRGQIVFVAATGAERRAIGAGIATVQTGIGAARAAAGAREAIAAGATGLVSCGVAAGLSPGLRAGDIVLPSELIGDDSGPVDPRWHEAAGRALGESLRIDGGPLIEVAALVRTPAEKSELWQRTGATCADMESATLAHIAAAAGIPFISLRIIADSAGDTLPAAAAEAIGPGGELQPSHLAGALLRRPGDWPDALKLARCFRRARIELTKASALTHSALQRL